MDQYQPHDELTRVENAVLAGRKIEAIKIYREMTLVGLADAKRAVDEIEARLRVEAPERFARGAGKTGCSVQMGIFALCCGAAWVILF